jgi:hypothetical protein
LISFEYCFLKEMYVSIVSNTYDRNCNNMKNFVLLQFSSEL